MKSSFAYGFLYAEITENTKNYTSHLNKSIDIAQIVDIWTCKKEKCAKIIEKKNHLCILGLTF